MTIIDTEKIVVPNWFSRKDMEEIVEEEIKLKDFKEFRSWLADSEYPSTISEEMRIMWRDFVQEKIEEANREMRGE